MDNRYHKMSKSQLSREIEIMDWCNKAINEEKINIQHNLNTVLEYTQVFAENDLLNPGVLDAIVKIDNWLRGVNEWHIK